MRLHFRRMYDVPHCLVTVVVGQDLMRLLFRKPFCNVTHKLLVITRLDESAFQKNMK